MVVKILPSATSFAGGDYNEKRASEGEAELVTAKNFGNAITFRRRAARVQALTRNTYRCRARRIPESRPPNSMP